MEDAGASQIWISEAGGMGAALDAQTTRFDSDQIDGLVFEKGVEYPDRVRAAADAGDDRVGKPFFSGDDLGARLLADDRLEVAHHGRVGMWAQRRAQQIVGITDVGNPVADRLVDGIFQGLAPGFDRSDLSSQELHPRDVRCLAIHVDRAHVNQAIQA